jgi:hypothetical protein
MTELATVAPAFVAMAHPIVYATVATVDRAGRPRTRIMHLVWEWDGERLTGIAGTVPTPLRRAHLASSPYVSCSYWSPSHDTCVADCRAELLLDDAARRNVWERLKAGPEPAGYDPAIVPMWADGPTSDQFAGLRLEPWRLRVFPGTVLLGQGGDILTWQAPGR